MSYVNLVNIIVTISVLSLITKINLAFPNSWFIRVL